MFGNKGGFTIKKSGIMGSPKPDKVDVKKVASKASGMKMAMQRGSFGNNGT